MKSRFTSRNVLLAGLAAVLLCACSGNAGQTGAVAPQPTAAVAPAAAPAAANPAVDTPIDVAAPDDVVDSRSSTVIAADVHAGSAGSACEVIGDGALVTVSGGQLRLADKVHYRVGKAGIHDRSLPMLDALAGRLCLEPTLAVEIGVHTDGRGSSVYNHKLSQERADAVRKYLIDRGIAPRQLRAVGYGEDRPLGHASHEEQRRTEFVILSR